MKHLLADVSSSLTEHLMWPSVVAILGVIAIIVLRKPLGRLIDRVVKIERGGITATPHPDNQTVKEQHSIHALNGDWTGHFREYNQDTQTEEVHLEGIHFQINELVVSGVVDSRHGITTRRYPIKAEFQSGFLVISFFSTNPKRRGAAAYVLEGDPEAGVLKGYWVGYDPDICAMMAGPYVLVREKNNRDAHRAHQEWLGKPLYRNK